MVIERNGEKYHISDSNKKLKPNKTTAFLIWNLPAVVTCPYRTAHCEQFCYARKSEKAYPSVLPARYDNFKASRSSDFVKVMTEIIVNKARKTRKEKLVVRVHESGDFYNRAYAMAWLEIARRVAKETKDFHTSVQFIAYSKSFVFFDSVTFPENFSLRASLWDDTKPEQISIVLRNNWAIYTAVKRFTKQDTFHQCRCEDCAGCAKCWDASVPDIRCEIH